MGIGTKYEGLDPHDPAMFERQPVTADPNVAHRWALVLDELRGHVGEFTWHIWIDPLELAGWRGTHLYVAAPDHVRTTVLNRYARHVLAAARAALENPSITLEIVDTHFDPPTERPPTVAARNEDAPPGQLSGETGRRETTLKTPPERTDP